MARVLVAGTLAIDYLGAYPGRFAVLPKDTNMNFTVQLGGVERAFGGCAANICYSLILLGDDPIPVMTTGREFEPEYRAHFDSLGIDTRGIRVLRDEAGAHAFIITDADGNQFTGFYPGPTDRGDATELLGAHLTPQTAMVVLAPDVAPKMIEQARWLTAQAIPVLCDPGQGVNDFSRAEMTELIDVSRWLVVNHYEWRMLTERLRWSDAELLERLDWAVVTHGADGVEWRRPGASSLQVAAVEPRRMIDPTGCGDAFRAGLIHGLARQAPMGEALRCAATVATLNLESHGTQTHRLDTLGERYREAWGDLPMWLVAAARG